MTTDRPPLRWGIASTGRIAAEMCEALATLPEATVTAVGSRSQDSADDFAARFGIPRAHGSYEALYADADVDIVYVASPHSHHHQMTIAALDAGKHVLCEKAFALNAHEAEEMVAAARRNQRFLMEAMWMWFIPAVVDVRQRVLDGEIGDLTLVDADFGLPIFDPDGRHRRADLAGGALLDLGIYPISLARFLAGDVAEVKALGTLGDSGVDANVGGVLEFVNGVISTFRTSLDTLTSLGATVVGSVGRIDIDPPFWHSAGFTVRLAGEPPVHVDMPNAGLAHEAAHAMERIAGGHLESDVIPLDATVATMRLLDDIRSQIGVVYPAER
jgi:predicted dehydrogenase